MKYIRVLRCNLFVLCILTWLSASLVFGDDTGPTNNQQVERIPSLKEKEEEEKRTGYIPSRGRKSSESDELTGIENPQEVYKDQLEGKRGPFLGSRGKKLVLYPFFDYSWRSARVPRMRKAEVPGVLEVGQKGASGYPKQVTNDVYDWKRNSLFYGGRGKKSQPTLTSDGLLSTYIDPNILYLNEIGLERDDLPLQEKNMVLSPTEGRRSASDDGWGWPLDGVKDSRIDFDRTEKRTQSFFGSRG